MEREREVHIDGAREDREKLKGVPGHEGEQP